MKLRPHISFEKYINILAPKMASPGIEPALCQLYRRHAFVAYNLKNSFSFSVFITASGMTYTVSSGALNSAPTKSLPIPVSAWLGRSRT